jgi:hypothetical protein
VSAIRTIPVTTYFGRTGKDDRLRDGRRITNAAFDAALTEAKAERNLARERGAEGEGKAHMVRRTCEALPRESLRDYVDERG